MHLDLAAAPCRAARPPTRARPPPRAHHPLAGCAGENPLRGDNRKESEYLTKYKEVQLPSFMTPETREVMHALVDLLELLSPTAFTSTCSDPSLHLL